MEKIKNINLGILLIRVSVGFLMLLHGIAKLSHGVGPIVGMVESQGLPGFFAYGVYVGEVLAPLALIIGFRTRIAAGIFIVNMLVIIFMAHPADILALSETGGWKLELVGLYLFGALSLFFTGGGRYGLSSNNTWD